MWPGLAVQGAQVVGVNAAESVVAVERVGEGAAGGDVPVEYLAQDLLGCDLTDDGGLPRARATFTASTRPVTGR
jgi:hypothetical protein